MDIVEQHLDAAATGVADLLVEMDLRDSRKVADGISVGWASLRSTPYALS